MELPSDQRGGFAQRLKDPSSSLHRHMVLALICLLCFGVYFCFDTPGALEAPIESAMFVGTGQFTSLYALYAWPNVIMCFFGGLLIDRVLGLRLATILFPAILIAGQLTFACGAFAGRFWLMQVGRFIYGLGGESLAVAENTYACIWFKGRELNLVFGLMNTVSALGNTLVFNTMLPIYGRAKSLVREPQMALGCSLLVAGLTCVMSLVVAIVLAIVDKRAERMLQRRPSAKVGAPNTMRDVTTFSANFWLLTLICVSFHLTIFPFISLGSVFFRRKWDYEPGQADALASLTYVVSACLGPLVGLLLDKLAGKNLLFILAGSLLVMFSHLVMALTRCNLWIPMIPFSVGYSVICSSLWPLVASVVPEHQLGTAYGVIQAVMNLGLAITNSLTGLLVDWKGYIVLELFFLLWVTVSMLLTVLLLARNGCSLRGEALGHPKASLNGLETQTGSSRHLATTEPQTTTICVQHQRQNGPKTRSNKLCGCQSGGLNDEAVC